MLDEGLLVDLSLRILSSIKQPGRASQLQSHRAGSPALKRSLSAYLAQVTFYLIEDMAGICLPHKNMQGHQGQKTLL